MTDKQQHFADTSYPAPAPAYLPPYRNPPKTQTHGEPSSAAEPQSKFEAAAILPGIVEVTAGSVLS